MLYISICKANFFVIISNLSSKKPSFISVGGHKIVDPTYDYNHRSDFRYSVVVFSSANRNLLNPNFDTFNFNINDYICTGIILH